MKTINMMASCVQNIIQVINDITHGCGEGAKMFDDAMTHARTQQLEEQKKQLETA